MLREAPQDRASRDSQIIRVAFDAHDPQLAADFANTLARTFIEQT